MLSRPKEERPRILSEAIPDRKRALMRSTPQRPARARSGQERPSGFGPAKSLLSLALLGGMAGVVFPGVDAYVSHSRHEQAAEELVQIVEGFHQHRQDKACWPAAIDTPAVVTQRRDLSAYPSLFPAHDGLAEGDNATRLATQLDPPQDPWGTPYVVCSFARGFDGTRGGLVLLSAGPDGQIQSDDKQIFNARPTGDDLTQLITFNLR